VDDLDAAIDFLNSKGITLLGDVVDSKQGAAGQRWIYFLTPWGMQCELVSYPQGKAYEATSDVVMWNPTKPAE
jgi:glyoxylase I family protein